MYYVTIHKLIINTVAWLFIDTFNLLLFYTFKYELT